MSGSTTIGGLLAPSNARGQHSRAVSLPVFAQQLQDSNGGYNSNAGLGAGLGNGNSGGHGGHRYQSSFSGLANMGSGMGLAIQEPGNGQGMGLMGWAEEELVQ